MPRNVLQLFTDDFVVTVRPSGTEAKLKLYGQLLPGGAPRTSGRALLAELRRTADDVARQVYGDLLARIDLSLGEAALLLPDIVDLDRKLEFEQETVPRLRERLSSGGLQDLRSTLAWLAERSAAMTPGTDPLPALKAPLAHLCREWSGDGVALVDELAAWASEE